MMSFTNAHAHGRLFERASSITESCATLLYHRHATVYNRERVGLTLFLSPAVPTMYPAALLSFPKDRSPSLRQRILNMYPKQFIPWTELHATVSLIPISHHSSAVHAGRSASPPSGRVHVSTRNGIP